MNCKFCGNQIENNERYCSVCGREVENFTPGEPVGNTPVKEKSVNKNTVLIVVLAVICVVLLLVAIAVGTTQSEVRITDAIRYNGKVEETPVATARTTPSPTPAPNVSERIRGCIENARKTGDVGVVVYDNLSDSMYGTASAVRYPAWGLYVPIYLAASDSPGSVSAAVRENIMSSDAGKCNAAGNTAIKALGGLHEVNRLLSGRYNASVTSYGRLFAQTGSTGENYTNAREAAGFLQILNERMEYDKLAYPLHSYGIAAPVGAQVYAHVGTENKAKMENLNLFAIVKGTYSDYCVVVMTKNGAGKDGLISDILQTVHMEMERM